MMKKMHRMISPHPLSKKVRNKPEIEEANNRIHNFIEESLPVFEMHKFHTKGGPDTTGHQFKSLKERESKCYLSCMEVGKYTITRL